MTADTLVPERAVHEGTTRLDAGLTPEQRDIVEWGDGPLVVIAGAGTGKTRVIVERVRWLLETKGEASVGAKDEAADPFARPLLPEQILVLTYNVKAAKELADRIEAAVGPAVRSRLAVSNFHAFCHRILTESAADAGLPARPDVLDGVGQVLLLRDLRPSLPLLYYAGGSNPNYWLDQFVAFLNRAKDELVTPADFQGYVERERAAFGDRDGSYERALDRLRAQGNLEPLRKVRPTYADLRRAERAIEAGDETAAADPTALEKAADREARRTVAGNGHAEPRWTFTEAERTAIDRLAATYVVDAAALEVLRLSELALVYRAYQDELERRGALDFGEQIAAVATLFKHRPNVLRRYQRQYRYILVDEFQDANIAQIELIELLGRTPDRPDNVMVVGDDDQSIYRFRGASFAAFVEFDRRFSGPPAHDPSAPAPGLPPRRRVETNFRSTPPILAAANRLICRNLLRYEPDKRLAPDRGGDAPVELATCAGAQDEAEAIVERIQALTGWDPAIGSEPAIPWSSFAVLYRKHRHRDAIVGRLREAGIPYTVSGGLSLFEAPEIRDLEQSLRAIADPEADVALARMLTAGPWRLDALELLRVARMAKFDGRRLLEAVREVVAEGEVEIDRLPEANGQENGSNGNGSNSSNGHGGGLALQPAAPDLLAEPPATATTLASARALPTTRVPVEPATRAKLRRVLETLDEFTALAWREGPFTILERFLERTGQVLDLLAIDTLEAKRTVANIASLMRFAADWQAEHPRGSLAAFVDYLDAYQGAGGELPTSVELAEDVQGVRLMTLYQAKGLEYRHVFIPYLLKDEWPAREYGSGLFPKELLKEAVPVGDIHTEEERRLLYVAMTRAQDGLMLTTHGGPTMDRERSRFVAELLEDAGPELVAVDRVGALAPTSEEEAEAAEGEEAPGEADELEATLALERVMALPSRRERRTALRLRATELIGMLEGVETAHSEAGPARAAFVDELRKVGEATVRSADEARAAGLDPLTLRTVALDALAGASLLEVAPLPRAFSYSQFDAYERCPLQYALRHVYRIPTSQTVGALTFGSSAHAAFEAFTRERRERAARGEPPPTREDLDRLFRAEWQPGGFPDRVTEETYQRRTASLLDNFWAGELAGVGEALAEELPFELHLEPGDGSPPVPVAGMIDRIDRLRSGGIEVIDYKTGRPTSQKGVDESLQLSIYALACRDELGLGTPERVTLYFTEAATRMTTTRTDEQLDAARADILAQAARIRSGDFGATPSANECWRCDYRAMCPERAS